MHHGFMHDGARVDGICRTVVFIHQRGQQRLIKRAPVHADAHGALKLQRGFNHAGEVAVLLLLEAHIAGIDAVFRQRLGAGRMVIEQRVAVVMEITHQRHGHAHLVQPIADMGHGLGRFIAVHGDADKLGAGPCKVCRLAGGAFNIGRIRIGHGLHDNGRAAAHLDVAHHDSMGFSPRFSSRIGHRYSLPPNWPAEPARSRRRNNLLPKQRRGRKRRQ